VRSQCRQPARARLRKTAGGQVRNLPLLVRGGQVGNLPLLVRGGQVGNLPLLVRGGQVGNLPLPVREREGRRGGDAIPPSSPRGGEEGEQGKVKADADNPHAPVYARRPVGRLGTCPYWYGVGRLETCPSWCGNGREGEGGDAIPPSSPRGGEEGEQGEGEEPMPTTRTRPSTQDGRWAG